jgi:GNAT superfamily N-acetyltransferase
MTSSPVNVRACVPEDVWGLRQSVLRPHQSLADMHWDKDYADGSAHFCAEDGSGRIVSVGSVQREPAPWLTGSVATAPAAPRRPDGWRLRGMATVDEWRGRGAGAGVLASLIDHVAQHGGGVLWCFARVPAFSFYRRAGFVERGDRWDEPVIGPHALMWRTVDDVARGHDGLTGQDG